MRLEMAGFRVKRIVFGAPTALKDGVLTVERAAISALADGESNITGVAVELAHPGESTRIIHVIDAVEPRFKPAGATFPWFISPPDLVGSGVTHRLDGVAVVATGDIPGAADSQGLKEAIIDMSGEGARYSPFSALANVVLLFSFAPGVHIPGAAASVRRVTMRVARYLAEATRAMKPDSVDVYELGRADAGLPRVVYIMPTMSEGELHTTFLYGMSVTSTPALVHPNEVLDGALVSADYWIACHRSPTHHYQNEPVIRALYRRHGRDLDFAGVILGRSLIPSAVEKHRQAAQMAKVATMLGAQGAVITMSNGGHAYADQMLICQHVEQAGIATVLGVDEYSDTDGSDFPLVTYVPQAKAIVSVGNQEEIIELPAVSRVLGGERFLSGNDYETGFRKRPDEAFPVGLRQLYASTCQLGYTTHRGRAY
ncbi:MAG: hypothetical protein IT529_11815 [Burkholderiales bacterium]|nr:hypothetical protein [Burkholderiales bacterium]